MSAPPHLLALWLKLRLLMRAQERRLRKSWDVAPAVIDAQVAEVAKQLRQAVPINILSTLVIAGLFIDIQHNLPLLASCATLFGLTVSGLFFMPHAPFCRVSYRDGRQARAVIHGYALATGLAWAAMMVAPLLTANESDRMYLFSVLVAATCVGGLIMAMLPFAALIYTAVMGAGMAFALALQPIHIPNAIFFACGLYVFMLARVFFDLADLFVGQLQAAAELKEAEAAKRESQRIEIERRAAEQASRDSERQAAREEEQARHRADLLRLAQEFEASVVAVVRSLGDAVGKLQDSSGTLHQIGREASAKASAASDRATSASEAVASVAAASDQMVAAVGHVSARVAEQVAASQTARDSAEETRRALGELAESAEDIAAVATLIQDIAANTNLLALNATIEAARAGEAGRGFAVVAQEVKTLANQTGSAIGRIGDTVTAIQARVAIALAAVDRAGTQVDAVTEGAAAIAQAVTQQRTASDHIGRNAAAAADDAQDVHANIAQLAARARETDTMTEVMAALATRLDDQSRTLAQASRAFLDRLRAA